jgi:endo-1,4-beta-mannosidase
LSIGAADRFRLGVNYWPRRKAMYWWPEFDRGEVAEEFDVIASLGMSVVRVFLLWDDWQPSPDSVSPQRLRDLGLVLDLAAERELGLDVTSTRIHPSPHVRQVVSGGMVVDTGYRNMFHDRSALDAERFLLETVVGEYRDHAGVWMWNLGNEPDLFAHPRDAAAGRSWVREMTQLVKGIDPDHTVTTGLHTANLFADNGLRVDHVFAESDVAVMHGYPMYVDWARDPLDPDFVPYLCALVTGLTGKPCLAEEWGGCTSPDNAGSTTWAWTAYGAPRAQFMAGEEAFAEYVEEVLPRLVDVGATGAFMWCFSDYHPDLWDRPPCDEGGAKHERHFGLVRPDGSLKPHAEVIRRFAATGPTVRAPVKTLTLDVTSDEYYLDPASHARRLYQDW